MMHEMYLKPLRSSTETLNPPYLDKTLLQGLNASYG